MNISLSFTETEPTKSNLNCHKNFLNELKCEWLKCMYVTSCVRCVIVIAYKAMMWCMCFSKPSIWPQEWPEIKQRRSHPHRMKRSPCWLYSHRHTILQHNPAEDENIMSYFWCLMSESKTNVWECVTTAGYWTVDLRKTYNRWQW